MGVKGENVQRQNMKADDNQDGRGRAKSVATRKSSEEMLEMAAGYSPGRDRLGQGQAARRVLGSLLPSCISGK